MTAALLVTHVRFPTGNHGNHNNIHFAEGDFYANESTNKCNCPGKSKL